MKIRQGAPSLRPMHTLNPASDEQASIAKTESSANHPAKPCARWERPPRHSAERRSVMARAARLLCTSRVSPPSSAAVPDAHRNASIHCHCYLRASREAEAEAFEKLTGQKFSREQRVFLLVCGQYMEEE